MKGKIKMQENKNEELNLDELNLEDLDINVNSDTEVEIQDEKNKSNDLLDTSEDLEKIMDEAGNKNKKKQAKKASDKKQAKKTSDKKQANKEEKYTGPRIVKVYGDELFTVEDPEISNEDIRLKLVSEFGYKEFKKDNTIFDLDKESGILDVTKRFEKKG